MLTRAERKTIGNVHNRVPRDTGVDLYPLERMVESALRFQYIIVIHKKVNVILLKRIFNRWYISIMRNVRSYLPKPSQIDPIVIL